MISANELRLGNIINCLAKDGFWYKSVVSGLTNNEITVGVGIIPSDINPIPLTEQILLKCGFEKSQAIEFGFTRPLFQYIVKRQFRWDYVIFNNDNSYSIVCDNIHYLHQLQNLVHSLTGQELDCTQILHNEII